MLDIKYIRDNVNTLKTAIRNKQMNPEIVDEVIRVDKRRRELIQQVEELRGQANAHVAAMKGRKPTEQEIEVGRKYKQQLQDIEPELKQVEKTFQDLMYQVPNPAADDVPVGKDESGNKVVKTWGELPKFKFAPKTHDELAESLDLLDVKRAVRIAGNRGYFLKNDLVILEQAVLNYALRMMIDAGFTPMTVPWMVNDDAMWGTGYFPWGQQDHYNTQDGQKLIGTADQTDKLITALQEARKELK
jgi:seryl-tRNA synthetase